MNKIELLRNKLGKAWFFKYLLGEEKFSMHIPEEKRKAEKYPVIQMINLTSLDHTVRFS
jgi:hypothetical protein